MLAERIIVNRKFTVKRMTTQDKIKANRTTSMQWFYKSNGILRQLFSAQKCNTAGRENSGEKVKMTKNIVFKVFCKILT